MVDLHGQYLKIKANIDRAIQACIDTTAFIKGPQVSYFENQLADFLNVGHVVSCANGTDALQLALMALNLQPGDEIIIPAFTYIAVAEVIALLRLTPVLVDVDARTFNISPEQIERAITSRTKLVVPVHLFGQCADMERILSICNQYQLHVIEDAAQAIGAMVTFADGTSGMAGTMGDFGTTSFFPSKNLGCFGDGGAILTQDSERAGQVKMLANHGQSRKYHHELVGINSRLDSLQAAILSEKLPYLLAYTQARQQAAAQYDDRLSAIDAIEIPHRSKYSTHVFHQYTLKVPPDQRNGLKDYLQQKGIPSMVYYPIPVSSQKAYEKLGRVVGDLAITHELCQRVLSLPMHTELSEQQIDYITETITDYFQ
ncbi:DegT/DnrJ/EryC1/StrS family aminotransferase [Spirosoma sp. BT704]|uniref:DegT/DnrJ/EryC1/StrS family aminotransferase n=2 Tax=Spirosoma validum TaxID=2771355 RepID=A0A927GCI4_9BACT|nr:DegT/DnrJ/EryC1/StrS family aminotransferase [Spirosoma validum]